MELPINRIRAAPKACLTYELTEEDALAMPIYYLHVFKDGSLAKDDEGGDFPNDAAVRCEAIVSAREMMAHDLRKGLIDLKSKIAIENRFHQEIFTVEFSDAVAFERAQPLGLEL